MLADLVKKNRQAKPESSKVESWVSTKPSKVASREFSIQPTNDAITPTKPQILARKWFTRSWINFSICICILALLKNGFIAATLSFSPCFPYEPACLQLSIHCLGKANSALTLPRQSLPAQALRWLGNISKQTSLFHVLAQKNKLLHGLPQQGNTVPGEGTKQALGVCCHPSPPHGLNKLSRTCIDHI